MDRLSARQNRFRKSAQSKKTDDFSYLHRKMNENVEDSLSS